MTSAAMLFAYLSAAFGLWCFGAFVEGMVAR